MLDNIRLPNDLNKAVIYINILILVATLTYSLAASNNPLIPTPLAFVFSSIVSMFFSLCVWGYKESELNRFEKRHGRFSQSTKHRAFYNDGYAERLNISDAVSVIGFMFMHMIALIIQFK